MNCLGSKSTNSRRTSQQCELYSSLSILFAKLVVSDFDSISMRMAVSLMRALDVFAADRPRALALRPTSLTRLSKPRPSTQSPRALAQWISWSATPAVSRRAHFLERPTQAGRDFGRVCAELSRANLTLRSAGASAAPRGGQSLDSCANMI